MSATRFVSGSHVTPYQLVQQSAPAHVLKMPKEDDSFRADLNVCSAARSDGRQALAVRVTASSSVSVVMKKSPNACMLLSVSLICM